MRPAGRWRRVVGAWAAGALLLLLPACAWRGAGALKLTGEGHAEACLGEVVTVEGVAEDFWNGAYVDETAAYPGAFRLNDLPAWPSDAVGKGVSVTGRLVRNPASAEAADVRSQGRESGPEPPRYGLVEARWKLLRPYPKDAGASAPFRLRSDEQVEAHAGGFVEVVGFARTGPDPRVDALLGHRYLQFRLDAAAMLPEGMACKAVSVTGRLVRVAPHLTDVDELFVRYGADERPTPHYGLDDARWRVLEPSAVEDGEAPFRLSGREQFAGHRGRRVEVEGTAEGPGKGVPYVKTPFYRFELNGLAWWPVEVEQKRVVVTGRLVLNPGLSVEEARAIEEKAGGPLQWSGPHPPYFALDEARWKVVEPE